MSKNTDEKKFDLFEIVDRYELEKRKEKIKTNILKKIEEYNSIKSDIGSEINRYQNISAYVNFKKDPLAEKIRKEINRLFGASSKYLENSEKNFESDFVTKSGDGIFELVMADFINSISEDLKLSEYRKGNGLPDLEFLYQGQLYYLECTTRASSLLKDYLTENRWDIDRFYEVAKIFISVGKLVGGKSFRELYSLKLSDEKKSFVAEKLGFNGKKHVTDENFKEFNEWLNMHRYMFACFPQFLPHNYKEKLKNLKLTKQCELDYEGFANFLARSIAQSVIDKLQKRYFEQSKPVILAISLSLFQDPKMFTNVEKLINDIVESLPNEFEKVLCEKCETLDQLKKIQNNVPNLCAIILDTTWYNWFPGDLQAVTPKSFTNHYGLILNEQYKNNNNSNSLLAKIKEKIPYRYQINFDFS